VIVSFQVLQRKLERKVEMNISDLTNSSDQISDLEWEILLNFREPQEKWQENSEA